MLIVAIGLLSILVLILFLSHTTEGYSNHHIVCMGGIGFKFYCSWTEGGKIL